MGSLTLPSSGLICLDSSALIYSVEKYPSYWPVLRPVWQAGDRGLLTLVSSELALLEVLVGPLKHRQPVLAATYENILSAGVTLQTVDRDILRSAARLRAETNLKTPDAIHAATGSQRAARCS